MAKVGETVTVRRISGKDEVRQHLAELGFVVDSKIGGNLIVQGKDSRIALDKTMVNRIGESVTAANPVSRPDAVPGTDSLKYERYPGQGAYKLCFTSRDLDSVRKAQAILGDRFDFVVHPYGAGTNCFNGEIIPKCVDKGRGIELVCRRFGASPAAAVAFGDSMNDAAMLKRAGVSVAMDNACGELKALADVVCEDVSHDGVYLELHRMGLCG